MGLTRSSGILLHPSSLPGKFGIGDLGDEAYRFVDFLRAAGLTLWQVLPLGPTGYGNSPYQCLSAFAGNPLLISPQRLVEQRLLPETALDVDTRFSESRIDYGGVIDLKRSLIAQAFENFERSGNSQLRAEFESFTALAGAWLDNYAVFRAIKDNNSGRSWSIWPGPLTRRESEALDRAREELSYEIQANKFSQYLFFKQWFDLKEYANNQGVRIIGDLPIFLAYDSADVWASPSMFKLNEAREPVVVAGVPPDYFSKTGQLWGNPIYDWDRMKADRFQWWVNLLESVLKTVDIVRIDHFRGFAACWEVPAGDKTAEGGRWVDVPGREIFTAVRERLGDLPILAEDLGFITPDVDELREEFGLAGMRVLQFAFQDSHNTHLPHNYLRNAVVYTGTHDNDTCVGWFYSRSRIESEGDAETRSERTYCLEYLDSSGEEIHWDFIRAAMASVADIAIIPLQDVLGLDSAARMNVPSNPRGNWEWRFDSGALTPEISERLRSLVRIYGRDSSQERPESESRPRSRTYRAEHRLNHSAS